MTLFVAGFVIGAAVQALYCFKHRKRGTSRTIVILGPPEKINR